MVKVLWYVKIVFTSHCTSTNGKLLNPEISKMASTLHEDGWTMAIKQYKKAIFGM